MLDLVILDDSEQLAPRRDGLNRLKAVGGLYVPGDAVGELESRIAVLKAGRDFPPDSHSGELKWSPGVGLWMHDSLKGVDRSSFQVDIVDALVDSRCEAIVAIHEGDTPTQVVWASAIRMSHEVFREKGTGGLVVTDRPSDGSEKQFLNSCFHSTLAIAPHPRGNGLVLQPSTTDSSYVGLIQVADMIVGAALGAIAGMGVPADIIFEHLKRLMPSCRVDVPRGGRRILLEPWGLSNLYHWLLDDEVAVVDSQLIRLPHESLPYFTSADSP